MDVVEQAVDRNVPAKGVDERGTERLIDTGRQNTGVSLGRGSAAYDLVWDPAIFGVFFCPEIHEIQFDTPELHLCRLEMLRLIRIGFDSYRIFDRLRPVRSEKFCQTICE